MSNESAPEYAAVQRHLADHAERVWRTGSGWRSVLFLGIDADGTPHAGFSAPLALEDNERFAHVVRLARTALKFVALDLRHELPDGCGHASWPSPGAMREAAEKILASYEAAYDAHVASDDDKTPVP